MNNYKITNITNQLGKRDVNFNSILDIEYIDGMTKKVFKLTPNQTVFMKLVSLPISVHKMRIKNFVIVQEVNDSTVLVEMNKYIVVNNISPVIHPEETEEAKQERKIRKNNKATE
jgi:hypothetical protein